MRPPRLVTIVLSAMALAQSNPVPFINQPLVPETVPPGSGGFTLTVHGAGFAPTAIVKWNGSARSQKKAPAQPGSPQDVLTYHGDNLRTGWFSSETRLTAGNVNAQTFGLLQTVPLDGQVDAEPLVVMQQKIMGRGIHDVVYVATENDSIYAIDAATGAVLWRRRYGTPVPCAYKQDCGVFPVMGILGTPVIDRKAGAMYFVADVYSGKVDTFYLYAISLSSGRSLIKTTAIHFSERLPSGRLWALSPRFHLQRPGLLEVNGSIYIAFGSTGDQAPGQSRGTILRYDAATLNRLGGPITNKLLSRLSWKWRKRSSVKITERTYEEGTEAFHARRKSSHLEAASCGQSTRLGAV